MPTSARAASAAFCCRCGGCGRPVVPPRLQRPHLCKGGWLAKRDWGIVSEVYRYRVTPPPALRATSELPLSLPCPRCDAALSASGGGLFTAEKSPKCAGSCGPRSPVGPRGVHHRKRHCAGSCFPLSYPFHYPLPLPGFARASGIGQPLRLQDSSQMPHPLPRNTARHRTRQHYNPSVTALP